MRSIVWAVAAGIGATALPLPPSLGAQATAGPAATAPAAAPAPATAFDAYVQRGMHDWHVPGLAVAVVKDDSVVFQKAYGVQNITTGAPVDIHTRFAIGSTTKAMTVMALGMLVDEGKLHWDDRVIDHLPSFRLSDPYVTRDVRIRDLLTHRTGLGGEGDLLWIMPDLSEAEIVRRMRYLKPDVPFRSQFIYNNIMYQVAGDVVAAVSGMPWEQFLTERIWIPLGMRETIPTVARAIGQPNVVSPHDLVHDSVRVIPVQSTDQVKAAGSVYSSIADMTRWVQFLLDSGRVGGRRLVSDSVFREIFTPEIRAPRELYPALELSRPHFFTYGLGFFLQDYAGYELAMHTGSIDGLCALIALVPERHLGFYVLENVDHAELRHALMYRAIDTWLGTGTRDWSAELRGLLTARTASAAPGRRASRAAGERPGRAARAGRDSAPASLPLERYAGTYVDSTFGDVRITLASGALHLAYLSSEAALAHERSDIFRAHEATRKYLDSAAVTFLPDGTGGVRALRFFDITFDRVPPGPTGPSVSSAASGGTTGPDTPGAAVIRRMHDRYASSWYSTLSFTERAEQRAPDGTLTTATWWEEAKLPGRLRIDVGVPASDTVHPRRTIVYAGDSVYVKDSAGVVHRAKSLNLLLVLGFDVYRQPVERTIAQLTAEGFDLSRVHEGVWHGRPVEIVGAAAGDSTSKQFWIDRGRDVFVRLLEPPSPGLGGASDAWFDRYRPLAGGWIAVEVGVADKGVVRLHEIYSNVKANVPLPDAWFDPTRLR